MGIFEKFKLGFKKSANKISEGFREIVVKKEIDDNTLDKIEDEMQSYMREEGYVNFMRPGKGYQALPEFTLEDAEKIIHETTIRWLNNDPHGQDALKKLNTDSVLYNYEDGTYKIFGSASLDQGNGFALKQ